MMPALPVDDDHVHHLVVVNISTLPFEICRLSVE